jgi:hypothetical protein
MICLIHCENFYKCHSVPPTRKTIKKKVTGVDLLQRMPKALFQYPALPNKSPCTMCNFYAQWLQWWNLFKFQECSNTLSPTALENRKKYANSLYFMGLAKVNFPYLRIILLKKLYRSFSSWIKLTLAVSNQNI